MERGERVQHGSRFTDHQIPYRIPEHTWSMEIFCHRKENTFQAKGPANRMRIRVSCALYAYLLWWVSRTNPHCQPTTMHSMHDHEGERRLPGYILTAKFLQGVVQRRQACIRRLSEHEQTMRPDSTSDEPRLKPTPSVV